MNTGRTIAGRTASVVVLSLCLMCLAAIPAQALPSSVSAAAEKGAVPVLGSLPRSPVDTMATARTFSAALGSSSITGTLDPNTNGFDVFAVDVQAGEKITATLGGDPGTDFDLYLFWPTYESPDDFYLAAASVEWDYPEALEFTASAGGTYYLVASVYSGTGEYVLDYTVAAADAVCTPLRLWGPTRYETAIDACQHVFSDGSSRDVVLASGASYPDALSAAALAGSLGCPLLLVQPGELPQTVAAELVRLNAVEAHVVGGPAAVSRAVDRELGGAGVEVFRYEGANRYETSQKVALAVSQLHPFGTPDTVFVARGDLFADALSGSPLAYSRGYPVVLTDSSSLSPEAAVAIAAIGPEHVVILGMYAAVSRNVEQQLVGIVGAAAVDRIGGANRYETSRLIAEHGLDSFWATTHSIGVASGTNFPDALSGGAITGTEGGVLVLTEPTRLHEEAVQFLSHYADMDVIDEVLVYGGTAAISRGVYGDVEGTVR